LLTLNRGDDVETFWTAGQRQRRDGGFTLVELMMVVFILGMLALMAFASYHAVTGRAAEAACLSNQRTLNGALEIYKADRHGSLPPTFTLDDLRGAANTWERITECPLGGADLYYDAPSDSIICPNHPIL
jgi:prepilin-type N-terminal cleavage/methylation domain-containing protein